MERTVERSRQGWNEGDGWERKEIIREHGWLECSCEKHKGNGLKKCGCRKWRGQWREADKDGMRVLDGEGKGCEVNPEGWKAVGRSRKGRLKKMVDAGRGERVVDKWVGMEWR